MKEFKIVFIPVERPPLSRDWSRDVPNVGEGADVDLLKEMILEYLPSVSRDGVTTVYSLLYLCRSEKTLGAPPSLWGIVQISAEGNHLLECVAIKSLYKVRLSGGLETSRFVFFKLGEDAVPDDVACRGLPPLRNIYAVRAEEVVVS